MVSLAAAFVVLPRFHDYFFVWDHNFSSAVSLACGHGLAEVEGTVPALDDFLHRRRPDFDCALMPAGVRLGPLNAYAEGIPYFLRALGWYWRLTGVSWPALAPLFGVLFAVSNTVLFFLFRQFIGNALGAIFSVAYVVSPSNYHSLTHYEHYAKTPIFLSVMLLMVWLVRRCAASRQLIAASAAGGVLVGIGFGIRADLWLLAPLFVAAVAFFVGPALRLRSRMIACACFLGVATIVAIPAARAQGSSYFWLQLVQGLSTPFDTDLSLRPAVYEWMPQYSDSLGLNWMQTHAFFQVDRGSVAALDGFTGSSRAVPGVMDWQTREAAGRAGYLAIMRSFPADFMTRPFAAVLEVTGQSFRTQPQYAREFGAGPNFFARTLPFWSGVAAASVLLPAVIVAALFVFAASHKREALFLLVALLYVCGTTAIVFLPRHRWHLYFLGFLAVGVLTRFIASRASAPVIAIRRTGRVVAQALPIALLLAGIAAAAITLARAYQDRHLGTLIRQMLSADVDSVRLAPAALPGVIEAPDLIQHFQTQAMAADRFQYAHYLVATFSRDRCAGARQVKVLYRASQAFYDDTRTVDLDFSYDSSVFRFVFPAYEVKIGTDFGAFLGFDLGGADAGCLARLDRLRDPAALPFLITWHLPEHWEQAPRHQSIVFPARP